LSYRRFYKKAHLSTTYYSLFQAFLFLLFFTYLDIVLGRPELYKPQYAWIYWHAYFGRYFILVLILGCSLIVFLNLIVMSPFTYILLDCLLFSLSFTFLVHGGVLDFLWFKLQGREIPSELPWLDNALLMRWFRVRMGHEHLTAGDLTILCEFWVFVILTLTAICLLVKNTKK